MKKLLKITMKVLPVIIMLAIVVMPSLLAADILPGIPSDVSGTAGSQTAQKLAMNVWTTVVSVVQIASVAAVVFAGLRYMFASADAKADIKKQTVILVIGAILVFGASTVLTVISKIAADAGTGL